MISEKALAARRDYMRQYRAENRERILERQRDHIITTRRNIKNISGIIGNARRMKQQTDNYKEK